MSAVLLMGTISSAHAAPSSECEGASQIEIGNCVAKTEATVNKTIEMALGFAMNSAADLDQVTGRKVAVPALIAGQSAWEAYRDQHCAFVGATFGGGSGTGIAILDCRIELGRDRFDTLMDYVG